VIRRQAHRVDHADIDVLELEFRLPCFKTLAGLEADGYLLAAFQHRLGGKPSADQHRHDRHEPHQLHAPA
jgi:hypothetical protein